MKEHTVYLNWEERLEDIHDWSWDSSPCDTGTVPQQLSYQANWELITFVKLAQQEWDLNLLDHVKYDNKLEAAKMTERWDLHWNHDRNFRTVWIGNIKSLKFRLGSHVHNHS